MTTLIALIVRCNKILLPRAAFISAIATLIFTTSAAAQIVGFNSGSNYSINSFSIGESFFQNPPTPEILELTNGYISESNAAFYNTPQDISSFTTRFTYKADSSMYASSMGTGFTFCIQNSGPTAGGISSSSGAGLGYQSIDKSVAIAFNTSSGSPSGICLLTGGVVNNRFSNTSPVNMLSKDYIDVSINYADKMLTVLLTDENTKATFQQHYPIDISEWIQSSTAYIGFTGSTTQSSMSHQYIGNFSFYSPAPPIAPTNVTAAPGDSSVTLSWSACPRATSYNIFVGRSNSDIPITPVATGVSNSWFTDAHLPNGTQYYFSVSAVNKGGASTPSAVVSATPEAGLPSSPATLQTVAGAAPPVPAAPTGLSAYSNDKKVILSWTAVPSATFYNIYRGASAGGEAISPIATGVAVTSYVDAGLTNGTKYYYVITASGLNGASTVSSEISATPAPTAPPVPIGLKATTAGLQAMLTWKPSTGATYYNVYRGTSAGGEAISPVATDITNTSYNDTGLNSGTTYYYVVTAVNGTGTSGVSAETKVTPTP